MNFALDLSKFNIKTAEKASQFCRKVGLDLHARITQRTPVDTGRLKAGNQIAIGENPMTVDIGGSDQTPKGQMSSQTLSNALSGIKPFKLGDDIVIYNNVFYVVPIEFDSHSRQAPEGMFRISLQEIITHFGAMQVLPD